MSDPKDLQLLLKSGVPIVAIETTDEPHVLELLKRLAVSSPADGYRPAYRWSITDGLQRLDLELEHPRHDSEPTEVLRHVRAARKPGIYALLDFHPFLAEPVNTRLLKDIALEGRHCGVVLLLIGHSVSLPPELQGLSARCELRAPDAAERRRIVAGLVEEYRDDTLNRHIKIDEKALDLLIENMRGLSSADVERIARNAVYRDGAITAEDLPAVMQAKYELLNDGGVLSYEHDTATFADVAGFRSVKVWLQQRRFAFSDARPPGLDAPKGLLIIGVQGCGKSLAAKAAAGVLGVPLLRLDFGSIYDKYHGETERNLRESLKTAETMSPCVLWLDEIEKGLATGHDDSGTSRRVLGTLLTWMAERPSGVLLVATANDVHELPPELVRKGRFDEIFFADLPTPSGRADILAIHLRKRGLDPSAFDLPRLVAATDGFSGAEIEQGVVSALYAAYAMRQDASAAHLIAEFRKTRPLSVVMAERVAGLRHWAKDRTVAAD
jgi:hypothetical protein